MRGADRGRTEATVPLECINTSPLHRVSLRRRMRLVELHISSVFVISQKGVSFHTTSLTQPDPAKKKP